MTAFHRMMTDQTYDPHGKDWGNALFAAAFGAALDKAKRDASEAQLTDHPASEDYTKDEPKP